MLNEVMNNINNHFALDRTTEQLHGYEDGEFTLIGGTITVKNKYVVGQYIAITGSILNNGVYRVEKFEDGVITIKESDVNDKMWGETFDGTIYSLRVPESFIQLVEKIKTFTESNLGKSSNITSASFGIQSYSFGTDSNGVRAGWQTVFAPDLNAHRRYTPDIII